MLSLFTTLKNAFKYRGQLAPWSDATVEDLTFNISTYHVRSFTSKLGGKMYDGEGLPLIKFNRESRGMRTNGKIEAHSTDFRFLINIRDDNFGVLVNGKPLGIIQSSGTVLNADRKPIGSAVHPLKASANILGVKMRFADNTFPIHLYGKQIATMRVSPTSSNSARITLNEHFPGDTIVKVHGEITQEEEMWLIAMAIIEVVYHGHWIIGV
ncbi:MAG: hypothetical protein AB8B56_04930 [Crocinitomicaceae bacterium]